ncbi:MAG: glycolate oxidase subunit GlcE [Betaproteobacteria bacterium]|nr:glycolate oxidase subunit GlcE [Betaproteobacteria bacterium]
MENLIQSLTERVKQAASNNTPLAIHGGNSKSFYGGAIRGDALDLRAYTGIIDYEPKELVLTVRAGTPLQEIETALEAAGQMLPFEPPYYADTATIGGTVATGLSGPRRPYTGAVRDFVLGTRIINGKGEDLSFGGRVIKNVAGYDVSRLMTGAMGTLGVLLDISFKVLPKPTDEITLRFEMDEATAIQRFNEWAGKPLPISATSWHQGVAMVRLSGAAAGVKAAREKLGGEAVADAQAFWRDLRDHRAPFFEDAEPLRRLSVPSTTSPLSLDLPQWIEWGGALRWVKGAADVKVLREKIASVGGHATLFRHGDKSVGVFHPLAPVLAKIHVNLKAAFDPDNILNPGRMDNFS